MKIKEVKILKTKKCLQLLIKSSLKPFKIFFGL